MYGFSARPKNVDVNADSQPRGLTVYSWQSLH